MMDILLRESRLRPAERLGPMALAAALCLLPAAAPAALGGDAASVEADQAAMNASEQISAGNGYQVHELQNGAGMKVREYLSDGGRVFAVAWEGPMLPDLKRLLGSYFARYTAAARTHRGGHVHRGVHQDDLVVESSGHMRAFFGRAYLPKALPAGVTASAIR
jgi:hypothetical protein